MLNQKKLKYLIFGDFNVDLMKYNLANGITEYLDAIHSTGCNAFIDKPTRIISSAATCIDHVYSNMHTESLENHITLSSVSDHFGTLTKIKGVTKEIDRKDLYFRKTKLSDEKWKQFNLEYQNALKGNVPFPHLLNANSLAESITNTYHEVIDKFMPLKRKPFKKLKENPDRPWLTSGLKASIKTMFKLLQHSKLTRSAEDYEKYKTYLNKLTRLKEKAKDKYYRDKSELYGNNKSKTWQLVNEITSYKRKKSQAIKSMTDKNGKKLKDSASIANCLNDFFATIGKNMAQEIEKMDGTRLRDPLSYISKDVKNSLFLSLPNSHEISKIISKLDTNKSSHGLVSNKVAKI